MTHVPHLYSVLARATEVLAALPWLVSYRLNTIISCSCVHYESHVREQLTHRSPPSVLPYELAVSTREAQQRVPLHARSETPLPEAAQRYEDSHAQVVLKDTRDLCLFLSKPLYFHNGFFLPF